MAIQLTKRPFLPLVSRIPLLVLSACKSYLLPSVNPNTHFWLRNNPTILHFFPSPTTVHRHPVHHPPRWVSSDTRCTCPEEEEDEEVSDELISNITEDPNDNNEDMILNKVESIINLSMEEGMTVLDNCGFVASSSLVRKLLCRTQSNWKAALTVFQWAGSQENYCHTVGAYHAMISILGMHKKFSVAWGLIREMHEKTMATHQTLRIMIKRYAAAQAVDKAIRTFHAMDKFKLAADYDDFLCLLRALCKYQYLVEAEELIYFNKKYFPLETKSFNVLLNGWGNILDVYQVKRLWNDMYNLCITPNFSSYTTIICCLSKAGKFYDVIKRYDEMKKKGFTPNLKVYNAVIYVLAKQNCLKEALHLFNRIQEMGFNPNAVTYISLILNLCIAWEVEEAYRILDEMIGKGFAPTIRIYHALFRFVKNGDTIFELIDRMKKTGCAPTMETYLMSIRRCCSWGQHENALKLWNSMEKHRFCTDDSSCIILLDGFFLSGKPGEASKCYEKMKAEGFSLDPKTNRMLESWVAGRKYAPLQLRENISKERTEREKKVY